MADVEMATDSHTRYSPAPCHENLLPGASTAVVHEQVPCRVEETLGEIASGQVELISLEGCSLTTAGLQSVVSALQNDDCSTSLMAMTLANNLLTDDSCSLLLTAMQSPAFCPSLLTLNLQDNPRLTELGFSMLQEMVSLRPDLQVLSFS